MAKKLVDQVDDGFNYFNSGILEELTTDKKYYVESFMKYIEVLESKLTKVRKEHRNILNDYQSPMWLMTYNDIVGGSQHEVVTNDPNLYLNRLNRDRIADGELPDKMEEYTKTLIHLETFKK
tara:strand:- start:70 stop:435 length:366 start_codon:yes stop_codon:yes gene_type:complete